MKTWQAELWVVGIVLFGVAALTGGRLEMIGAAAVLATFGHTQVADRLAEREAKRTQVALEGGNAPFVTSCHAMALRYLICKEILWLIYFSLHRSWAALAGVGLFLTYSIWRRYWRKHHPLGRNDAR